MAKKKTIIEQTIPDEPQIRDEEIRNAPWTKVKVYKITPLKSQPVYCFTSNTDIDEESLQNSSYGGGRYEVQYCDSDGQVIHSINYEVAEKPQPQQPLTAESIQIAMLKEQSQMNRDLLMAVLGTGGKASTPMSELATMWTVMNGSMGNNGADPMAKLIDVFLKGIDIGSGKSGETDWKAAGISALKDTLAPALTALVQAQTLKQGNAPGLLPNVQAPAISGNGGTPQPMDPDTILKNVLLPYIKPRIMAGMPADLALEWIITNANDPQYQPIISFAMSKTMDDLMTMDPEIANVPYKAWFEFILKGLKDHFAELSKVDAEQ